MVVVYLNIGQTNEPLQDESDGLGGKPIVNHRHVAFLLVSSAKSAACRETLTVEAFFIERSFGRHTPEK